MGALLTLLPLALQFAPQIASLLGGPAAGTALGHVADAAQAAFGTTDPEQIKLKMQQDASATERFKAEIDARLHELDAQLADLQDARHQTVDLAKVGSAIAWGAPIVSALVTFGFFGVLVLYLYRPIGSDNQVVTMLVGTMATAFGAVVQYWLGSSAGSKGKDTLLAQLSTTSTVTAAGTIKDAVGTVKKMFK